MENKIWDKEDQCELDYLQKYIDLYCFDSKSFKVPDDITPDNFKEFLEIILQQYHCYNIDNGHLMDLGDAVDTYFYRKYNKFDGYCNYPKNDRRELTFYISSNAIQSYTCWHILPEDVHFILECLNAHEEQIIDMYDKLESYFEQFDGVARCNIEHPRRSDAIKKERLEAIEKNQPLPIRPMGIKLDPCYKIKETQSKP